jgi:LacI family transcriptional regulator
VKKFGYAAAEAMDRLIAVDYYIWTKLVFGTAGVVTRQSTDILAIEDTEVVTAVRFIRSNCTARYSRQ